MKKTFGLLALTVGLVAGGCALLPRGPVANLNLNEGKLSGPVTLTVNIPQEMRTVQGLRSGVKMVEVFALTAKNQDLVTRAGSTVFATASVTGSGAAATITLPALPADGRSFFLVINGYTSTSVASASLMATIMDSNASDSFNPANSGVSSASSIVAQTEAFVTPVAGVPLPLSVTMYNCVSPTANLNYNNGDPTGMVYSSSFSGITPPTGGLPIRWFAWPFGDVASGLAASNDTKVRLTVYRPTGTWPAGVAYTQEGTGDATASVGMWDSASDSLDITPSSWNIDSTGKYAYCDINMATASCATASFKAGNGGSLSVLLPSFFAPTGYVATLTDKGNPVSLPGNGTL